jgi:hypothetical protein
VTEHVGFAIRVLGVWLTGRAATLQVRCTFGQVVFAALSHTPCRVSPTAAPADRACG